MSRVPFQQVDVFSEVPFRGNPLAVILDGSGLSDEAMLRIANWTNLSETTFLLPPSAPEADYQVRIFTTTGELPFAGHPTLGSCHAWLRAGGRPKAAHIVQQCKAGLIRIQRHEDGSLAFAAPPLVRSGPVDEETLARACRGLGLQRAEVLHAAWCDNGPGWIGLMLASAEAVLAASLGREGLNGLKVGLIGQYPGGPDQPATADSADFEVRAFFPRDGGTFEDPVTGSLNAAFASWLIPAGLAPATYRVSQGTVLGRSGRVRVEALSDRAGRTDYWIGGHCSACIEGSIQLGP